MPVKKSKSKKSKKSEKSTESNDSHVDSNDRSTVSLTCNLILDTKEHADRHGEGKGNSRIIFDDKLRRFTEGEYKEALDFYKSSIPGGKFDDPKGHVNKVFRFLVDEHSPTLIDGQSIHISVREAFEKVLKDSNTGPTEHYHTLTKLVSILSASTSKSANHEAGALLLHMGNEMRKLSKTMYQQDTKLHDKTEEEISKIIDEKMEQKFGKKIYSTANAFLDWTWCFSSSNTSSINFLTFHPENPVKIFGEMTFQKRALISAIAASRLMKNNDLCIDASSSDTMKMHVGTAQLISKWYISTFQEEIINRLQKAEEGSPLLEHFARR